MIWIYYLLLLAAAAVGLFLVLLTLPGLWLMTAAAAAYALVTRGHFVGLKTLATLFILTLLVEIFDWIIAPVAVRRAGGGHSADVAAVIGGIVGGIFLSLIPIPIISTILGICLGSFAGAAGAEFLAGRRARHSLRVGLSAAKGRMLGLSAKLGVGCLLLLVILWTAWP